jgi:hypothetical protein
MPRSASVVGLAKRGVIPQKQFYIEMFLFNTVILGCDRLFASRWYKFYKSEDDLMFASRHESQVYPTEDEIAYFFGSDLEEFIKDHWTYDEMSKEQRQLVHQKLDCIRTQFKNHPLDAAETGPPLCP